MDMFVEFQTKAISTCQQRCVNPEYKQGDLGRAEAVCSDRCIQKFFESSLLVQKLALEEMERKRNAVDAL